MEYTDKDIEEYRNSLELFENLEMELGDIVKVRYISRSNPGLGVQEVVGHLYQVNRFSDVVVRAFDNDVKAPFHYARTEDGGILMFHAYKISFSKEQLMLSITNMDGKELYYNPFLENELDKFVGTNYVPSYSEICDINQKMFGNIVDMAIIMSRDFTMTEDATSYLKRVMKDISPLPSGRRKMLE